MARSGERLALLAVDKESDEPLFSRVTEVRVLAGPDETAFVQAPGLDTAIPSRLAQAALEHAPGVRAVVVQGRYEHVSFILDPDPLRIVVREVVPPGPPKLADQLDRVIGMLDDLHPGAAGARRRRPDRRGAGARRPGTTCCPAVGPAVTWKVPGSPTSTSARRTTPTGSCSAATAR